MNIPTCKKNLIEWLSQSVDELNQDQASIVHCSKNTDLLRAWDHDVQVSCCIHDSLLTTHYSLLSLLTTHYSLLTTLFTTLTPHYSHSSLLSLLTTLTAHYSHYSLLSLLTTLTTHYSHYALLTTHYSPLTTLHVMLRILRRVQESAGSQTTLIPRSQKDCVRRAELCA